MSCDDFHAPFVPMEHIKNAWHASKGMGFHSVCIANCQNSHPVVDQEYIINLLGERPNNIWDMDQRYGWKERTHENDEYGTMYLLSSSYMQRTGRAGEVFSEEEFEPYHDTTALERAACGGVGSQGSISYDNHLWACCGLQSSGNPVLDVADLNTVPVVDAMKKVADNVILTAIHTVGPYALIRFVKEMDPTVTFKDQQTLAANGRDSSSAVIGAIQPLTCRQFAIIITAVEDPSTILSNTNRENVVLFGIHIVQNRLCRTQRYGMLRAHTTEQYTDIQFHHICTSFLL